MEYPYTTTLTCILLILTFSVFVWYIGSDHYKGNDQHWHDDHDDNDYHNFVG